MFFCYLVLGSTGLSGVTQCHLQGLGKDPQIRGLLLNQKKGKKNPFVSVTRFMHQYELT